MSTHPENNRLQEARTNKALWKKWGPCLSERQCGTVRQDFAKAQAAPATAPSPRQKK